MKEKYLRPAVINANTLEGNGVAPLVVAGVTITKAAALLGGFLAARLATKAVEARPLFKLPSLTKGMDSENDFCMA